MDELQDRQDYLRREIQFDPLAERPWQDVFYAALPAVLKVRPNDPRLYLLWGNLLQKYGRTPEAAAAWRNSAAKGGAWPSLIFSLAIVEVQPGGWR